MQANQSAVMDPYPVAAIAIAIAMALSLLLLLRKRRLSRRDGTNSDERVDTMLGWPPESRRVLSPVERLAFATLKRALPEFMVLAQVPVARFLTVPRDNSYREWMRRLGGHCVDLVVCDLSSQVLAVVVVEPANADITELLRRRFDRLPRSLQAAGIPAVTWHADSLPSIQAARASLAEHLRVEDDKGHRPERAIAPLPVAAERQSRESRAASWTDRTNGHPQHEPVRA